MIECVLSTTCSNVATHEILCMHLKRNVVKVILLYTQVHTQYTVFSVYLCEILCFHQTISFLVLTLCYYSNDNGTCSNVQA